MNGVPEGFVGTEAVEICRGLIPVEDRRLQVGDDDGLGQGVKNRPGCVQARHAAGHECLGSACTAMGHGPFRVSLTEVSLCCRQVFPGLKHFWLETPTVDPSRSVAGTDGSVRARHP